MNLEWRFDQKLCANQERLRQELKAGVNTWALKTYPELLTQLAATPLLNTLTALELFSSKVQDRADPVWIFLALCVRGQVRTIVRWW